MATAGFLKYILSAIIAETMMFFSQILANVTPVRHKFTAKGKVQNRISWTQR